MGDQGQKNPTGRKATIASRVSEDLREAILGGKLKPGSKLNLDQLRKQYQVSLSPMREAVSRLVADGLVEFEDQCGYRIIPVSMTRLQEITKLRSEMEPLALSLSIANSDLDWESDVLAALHRVNKAIAEGDPPHGGAEWAAAHSHFHAQLVKGCDMPLLINFCSVLHRLNDRYLRMFSAGDSDNRNIADEHSAIAHAAVAGETKAACDLMRIHIERTGTHLATRLAAALHE
ncbi:GntR family transcriptional regulator [Actibacterium lipolyticum]|uniref:HTH-type transcriptional repressor CsiR n=1 Tax=Actibacterium lipolyticum TaxID=1524263 RepID=A0A238KPV9_9RHOB|nr:GntR family transcriptional regulator [Actibacterium lipolyticum]SMX44697.1 HTH-type transcriptional repressor CsiR [Actibacterium lipolyticum]